MTIIAISRAVRFSPNHIDNDAAILNKVIEELCGKGHTVNTYNEEEFLEVSFPEMPVTVVTMARDVRTVNKLLEWEERGVPIINSPQGTLNCVRKPMTEILLQHEVPHPYSWIIKTEESLPQDVVFPCWCKRGDSHAVVKEDVCFANSREDAVCIVEDMRCRGIPSVVINEHLQGDLVKFYGVRGDTFFHWFYPSNTTHSKFGLETINGQIRGIEFEPSQLKLYADEAADVLQVPVYGGDAVISSDGSIRIIDFNDWPSFAPCREEAAKAIARIISLTRAYCEEEPK